MPQTFKINGPTTYIYAWNYTRSGRSSLTAVLKDCAGQTLTTYAWYDANYDIELYNLTRTRADYTY